MEQVIQKAYKETSKALNDIYERRKRTLFFQKIMWGLTGLYLLFMVLLLMRNYFPSMELDFIPAFKPFQPSQNNPYATVYPLVGLLVLLYPTTFLFAKAFQKFKLKEKESMAKMVRMLFPQVEFTQGATAPIKEVVQSKFFAWVKKETPIYSYGQIRGRVNDSIMNIADIGIVEQNTSNTVTGGLLHIPILNMLVVFYQNVFKNLVSNTTADNQYFTFRGMFCWLQFKKKLDGHTVVLPNSETTKWDRWASSNFKEEQRILLEDPRFTESFIVYGTDQVEARYVLSSSIMERIVALKEKFDRPIFLSFQNRQMYLAVLNPEGLFSFPSGRLDHIKVVEELANDIEMALEISSFN
ncbi:DUF3137 domain-containing protein [Flagellimonas sp.]|uniref:DUF3137 domain-containing protein n=1 Tax=Flagellimonas sp. TaxID=2058762 RepID=UPI003BA9551D